MHRFSICLAVCKNKGIKKTQIQTPPAYVQYEIDCRSWIRKTAFYTQTVHNPIFIKKKCIKSYIPIDILL